MLLQSMFLCRVAPSNARVFMLAFAISTYDSIRHQLHCKLLGLGLASGALHSSTIRIGSPSLNERGYPHPDYPGYFSHRSLLFAPLQLGQTRAVVSSPDVLIGICRAQKHNMVNFMESRFLVIKT